jgi:protein-tyrosine phosphatase
MSGVVTSVSFERDPGGRGVVSWTAEGDCDRVDIAWARTPDVIDHLHVLTVEVARQSVVLDEVPAGPAFVSVAPTGGGGAVVAGERNLGFAGPINFRDLGGYLGARGARTRWGRVFRSDALALEDQDLDLFAGLGIRAVYDLRGDSERETSPSRLPAGAHAIESVALISEGSPPPAVDALLADGESFLAGIYLHMLETSALGFGQILTGLADGSRLPAVFHCHAGKDRTGTVAALLLSVLGVAESDILDDYELTSRYRRKERLDAISERLRSENGVAPEVAAGILRTPRWAMQSALSELTRRYGGIEGYLTGPAAADRSVPGELRRLLLV